MGVRSWQKAIVWALGTGAVLVVVSGLILQGSFREWWYVRKLSSPDPRARLLAAMELDRLGGKGKKAVTRDLVFRALGSLSEDEQAELVGRWFRDPGTDKTGQVAEGLMPPIHAIVEQVRPKDDLVVLSVGRNQRVLEGFTFSVYRGDRFVGKVQVFKVYDDLAGAKVLYTPEGEAIRIGDRAHTQTPAPAPMR